MQTLQTEILVIGGGSTGVGVLRDLAMRGFDAILVEKNQLNEGTTGRYHGLLHSGGRYAVSDPEAARECIQENRILRTIMGHALDDTGGFFVTAPGDDTDFIDTWLAGCADNGVPTQAVPIAQMLKEEPALNPKISHAFWVPDAASYSGKATDATVASAYEYGGQVLARHEVGKLLRDNGRVTGAVCRDLEAQSDITIYADMVINATGAVANRIAALAGIEVSIIPGKGSMVAVGHLPLNTVVNRLRPSGDGDIIVPLYGEAAVGTTDSEIENPEEFGVTAREIELMLQAGEEVMPGFACAPNMRAWAGVRPLFPADGSGGAQEGGNNRMVSRSHALLDHAARDGVDGFVTITGGKWTTHRLMAEQTVDLVCQKLGVERPCRTHLEELPVPESEKFAVTMTAYR